MYNKFYLLLPKTKVKGIFIVYEKVKNDLNEEYSISVGATELKSDSFTEIDTCVNKALDEAIANSTIKESIDVNFVNDLLIDIRKKAYGW